MTRPGCAGSDIEKHCEKTVMRWRDGVGYCLFHPDSEPPALDPKTGKPITVTPLKRRTPAAQPRPTPTPKPRRQRPPRQPRPPKVKPEALTPGPCPTEGCRRLWPHTGRHALAPARLTVGRTMPAVDHAEAARRYTEGARLFDLATDLGIGVARLRRILNEQGVRIRNRGEVLERRGRQTAAPLDETRARELYATGLTTVQVGAMLGVRGERVAAVLRAADELRPPASNYKRDTPQHDVRLRLDPGLVTQARYRAAQLGHDHLTGYIRDLIHADLNTQQQDETDTRQANA